jgi:DNA-binding IclR family transcriptional regulator
VDGVLPSRQGPPVPRGASAALGISKRHIGRMIKDLVSVGMVVPVERVGASNRYYVDPEARLPNPTLAHVSLGRVIQAVMEIPRSE